MTSEDERDIVAVNGNHSNGKSNDDVTNFLFFSKTMNFFPHGITKFLKNIESLSVFNSSLSKITKDDLKEFGGKLKTFTICFTLIEVIESDLFSFNENIEIIFLGKNKIKFISFDAFGGLKKLNTLLLNDKSCGSFADQAIDLLKLVKVIRRIESKCKNSTSVAIQNGETVEYYSDIFSFAFRAVLKLFS